MIQNSETIRRELTAILGSGYRCPYCKVGVSVAEPTDWFTCPECKKRWLVGFELKIFEFLF